jgi:hypothetical protein
MVDRLAPCPRSLAPYLTAFGVVLSINNLSLAQARFASLQAQGFIISNVSNPLPSDTKTMNYADADSLLCKCWKERGSGEKVAEKMMPFFCSRRLLNNNK